MHLLQSKKLSFFLLYPDTKQGNHTYNERQRNQSNTFQESIDVCRCVGVGDPPTFDTLKLLQVQGYKCTSIYYYLLCKDVLGKFMGRHFTSHLPNDTPNASGLGSWDRPRDVSSIVASSAQQAAEIFRTSALRKACAAAAPSPIETASGDNPWKSPHLHGANRQSLEVLGDVTGCTDL